MLLTNALRGALARASVPGHSLLVARLCSAEATASSKDAAPPASAPAAPQVPEGPPPPPVRPADTGMRFIMDLTGRGADPEYFRNAHLSDRAKTEMFEAFTQDPARNSIDALAAKYKVRKQRVLAIITLKKLQLARAEAGQPLARDLAVQAEHYFGVCEVGTGEVFVSTTPTFPSFVVVPDDLPSERVPKPTQRNVDVSGAREKELFEDFEERLGRNTALVGLDGPDAPGAKLLVGSRITGAPRRPAGGWSLVVKPLGEGTNAQDKSKEAFVAQPDGSRRELNPHEEAMLRGQRVKPRRKLT